MKQEKGGSLTGFSRWGGKVALTLVTTVESVMGRTPSMFRVLQLHSGTHTVKVRCEAGGSPL